MRNRIAAGVAALSILLYLSTPARAQDAFDLEETVALCTTCHGEAGLPVDREIPIIWGQEFYYIYVQLRDYQAGRRANEIMSEMAQPYDKAQMKLIAQHFAEKEWPRIDPQTDATAAALGEGGLGAGQCSQCHSTYVGDSRVPRLAGQYPEYLEKTMQDFKRRIRLNSPAKGSLLGSFEDAQIRGMAHFLAGL